MDHAVITERLRYDIETAALVIGLLVLSIAAGALLLGLLSVITHAMVAATSWFYGPL